MSQFFLLNSFVKLLKVEEAVLVAGSNKKLILVLNKIGKLYICLCLSLMSVKYPRSGTQGSGRKMDEVSEE